jgi:hypothetical protein
VLFGVGVFIVRFISDDPEESFEHLHSWRLVLELDEGIE